MTMSRDELLSQIAEAEASLASIDHQREKVKQRLDALRREVVSISSTPTVTLQDEIRTAARAMTAADKVRLFRSLFRGRPVVYPIRFVSKKTGRVG